MKTEKKYLIYGISLILLTLIGISLAYFVTEIVGDKKSVSVSTGDLRIVFTDTDGTITGNDIEPGWSTTKTFSVENKTNSSYNYNIVIEDLVNTFSSTGYLVYKITSTDGGYNMEEYKDIPKSSTAKDVVLAYSITIPSKTTHNYTIEIKYLNDEDNSQNIDMNSTLSGKLDISEGSTPTLAEAILRDNPIVSERTDFSVTNTNNTTGTIYKTNKTEDDSTVYYYSGNTTNNWVKFGKENKSSCTYDNEAVEYYDYSTFEQRNALTESECTSTNICIVGLNKYSGLNSEQCTSLDGSLSDNIAVWYDYSDMYWRIIRTNEDGSVRLLYAGNYLNTTSGYILKTAYNESDNESKYTGYMYGGNSSLADNRTNTTDSTIKGVIDTWYQKNFLSDYDKYISKSAIYCNDRSVSSGTWVNAGNTFYYGTHTRLNTYKTPTYKCGGNGSGGLFESTQATQDKFSTSTIGGGNGQLIYPIALMTADELVFAGGKFNSSVYPYPYYFLNNIGTSVKDSEHWLLLSPYAFDNKSRIFKVSGSLYSAMLRFDSVSSSTAVRPVLSIDSCAKVTGTGTPEEPYIIDEQTSTC